MTVVVLIISRSALEHVGGDDSGHHTVNVGAGDFDLPCAKQRPAASVCDETIKDST